MAIGVDPIFVSYWTLDPAPCGRAFEAVFK